MSFRIWTIRSSQRANKSAGGVAALTYRSHWIVHCNEKFFYRDVGWYTNMTQAFLLRHSLPLAAAPFSGVVCQESEKSQLIYGSSFCITHMKIVYKTLLFLEV